MKASLIASLSLFLTFSLIAKEHHKGHHHGEAELTIVFEGKDGTIELEIPGDDAFGFEHVAKSEKDQQKQQQILKLLEEKISNLIIFDAKLKCAWTNNKAMVEQNGKHCSAKANYQVSCQSSLQDSVIKFNFAQDFPKLKEIEGTLIVDTLQKKLSLKNSDEVRVK